MKLHAVHSTKVNSVWIRNTACFCLKCFNKTFQPSTCCDGWKEFSVVKTKSQKGKKKENMSNIVIESKNIVIKPKVNDYVAAVYDDKVYIRKVHEVDDDDAYIFFLQHNGNLTRNTKFKLPKKDDDVWLPFDDVLCIIPEPLATKRALEICPEALDMVVKEFGNWQRRN